MSEGVFLNVKRNRGKLKFVQQGRKALGHHQERVRILIGVRIPGKGSCFRVLLIVSSVYCIV